MRPATSSTRSTSLGCAVRPAARSAALPLLIRVHPWLKILVRKVGGEGTHRLPLSPHESDTRSTPRLSAQTRAAEEELFGPCRDPGRGLDLGWLAALRRRSAGGCADFHGDRTSRKGENLYTKQTKETKGSDCRSVQFCQDSQNYSHPDPLS